MRNSGGVCEFRSENESANDEGKMLKISSKNITTIFHIDLISTCVMRLPQ